jgi:glutamine synthetase
LERRKIMPTKKEIKELVKQEGVKFISLQFTDIVGVVKNVTIPVEELDTALDYGIWFDGSSIEGFARIAESDMYLAPDPDTFAIIPWGAEEYKTARMICGVFTPNQEPFIGDPRHVLTKVMQEAEDMGFIYNTGPELEFFLFKRDDNGAIIPPQPHDTGGYFDLSADLGIEIRDQMSRALAAFGIEVEASHHEVAVGQHEIDFKYSNALRTADNAVTFRIVLKAIAQQNGLYATFMPKPIAGINGSGMHTHQSLIYKDSGRNAFVDPDDEYGLSEVAKHFIAGQMAHARGMCAVIAPLVNSYKRLVPGYEAPVYISWARINRSALIRVPEVNPGRLETTRLEFRSPDPSCNPYLAFAVMLKAGLDGIKRKLPVPEPVEEDVYHLGEVDMRERQLTTLPGSLAEALDELEKDEVIKEALGSHIYERFMEAKRQEWDEYRIQVTPWELERYLPIF